MCALVFVCVNDAYLLLDLRPRDVVVRVNDLIVLWDVKLQSGLIIIRLLLSLDQLLLYLLHCGGW